MSTRPTEPTGIQDEAAPFGILGHFPGDDALVAELEWCRQAYESPSALKPPLARLVQLLDHLPLKGRYAVARLYLAKSPFRDAIVRELFDYCFQKENTSATSHGDTPDGTIMVEAGGDDDSIDEAFIMIAYPATTSKATTADDAASSTSPLLSLNLHKFHIFQVVMVLLPLAGITGAELSRRYLQSASTKYRAKILIQCIECFGEAQLSSQELLEHYHQSSRSVQDKMVQTASQKKKRPLFLRKIYDLDAERHVDLVYYSLDPESFARELEKRSKDTVFTFQHWSSHGDVYLKCLCRLLEDCGQDSLQRGQVWDDFTARIDGKSMVARHVEELRKILETYAVCYLATDTPADVKTYLEAQSSEGHDISSFEFVHRKPLDVRFLKKMGHKKLLSMSTKLVQERDWAAFYAGGFHSLVPRHRLPVKEVFESTTADGLWCLLSQSKIQVDPFLKYFSEHTVFSKAPVGSEQVDILESWVAMHMRLLPTNLSPNQMHRYFPRKSRDDIWHIWYQSCTKYYRNHVPKLFSTINCESQVKIEMSKRLGSFSSQAKRVLKISVDTMKEALSYLQVNIAMDPLLFLLRSLSYPNLSRSEVDNARSLGDQAAAIVYSEVIPLLCNKLQFDPSVQNSYANIECITFFEKTISQLLKDWGASVNGTRDLSLVILELYSRAKLPEPRNRFILTEGEIPTKKRKFAYFNFALHNRVMLKCQDVMKSLLTGMRDNPAAERSLQKELWAVVRQPFAEYTLAYLELCLDHLPEDLLAEERPSILRNCTWMLDTWANFSSSKYNRAVVAVAPKLTLVDQLEDVLEKSNLSISDRNKILMKYGGFGNEKARQLLKDETSVADGESRALALQSLLMSAKESKSLASVAEALSFAVSRLKNESGMHRRTVFLSLEGHFIGDVVRLSLGNDALDIVKIHERIHASFLSILRHDLSRLDSVARHVCFPSLPRSILQEVLAFDPCQKCLVLRQLWITCAIQLDWELKSASVGELEMACYSFPSTLESELPSSSWISQATFESLYPLSTPSPPTNGASTATRRFSYAAAGLIHKGFDVESTFGPTQCVDMVANAVKTVWKDDLDVTALPLTGIFPEDEEIAGCLLARLLTLFCLCGRAWQESNLLTSIFDNIFNGIKTASAHQANHACLLLVRLVKGVNSGFDPRLTKAICALFRRAVAQEDQKMVQSLLPIWQKMYLEHDNHGYSRSMDGRLNGFVDEYDRLCSPVPSQQRTTCLSRTKRECCMAQDLLALSPSSISIGPVRKILFTRRQDVLLKLLRDGAGVGGPFLHLLEAQYNSLGEWLLENLDEHALLSTHPDISCKYAETALLEATSSATSLKAKVEAMSKFINAPTTQHKDVLHALNAELDDAVRESLINGVFLLDNPWQILGSLLSKRGLKKNDQRTTSALLSYVAKEVQVDKVVRVGGLLLGEDRRKGLTQQLHKGVVRMLFDAETIEARNLLHLEWNNDIPDTVRKLIVKTCVEQVLRGRTNGIEASILLDVARSDSKDLELNFCLLSPALCDGRGLLVIKEAVDVSSDETLELFLENGTIRVSVSSAQGVEAMRSILGEMEVFSSGTMKTLAQLKKLSLSHLFSAQNPRDDEGALDELLAILQTQPNAAASHVTQVASTCAMYMMASGACGILRAVDYASFSTHDTATKLRTCLQAQINMALDIPIRKHATRLLVLNNLQVLIMIINGAPNIGYRLQEPFLHDLYILRKDSETLQSVISGSRAPSVAPSLSLPLPPPPPPPPPPTSSLPPPPAQAPMSPGVYGQGRGRVNLVLGSSRGRGRGRGHLS